MSLTMPPGSTLTMSKLAVGCTSSREATALLCRNAVDHRRQRNVAQSVAVVRQEHLFAFEVRLDRFEPLADGGSWRRSRQT